jgi:hypothetical protein
MVMPDGAAPSSLRFGAGDNAGYHSIQLKAQ